MHKSPPLCIAGMHRSGTSLVTRLLHECGLYLGPEGKLMKPQPDNSAGFWENLPLVDLNDEILAHLGAGWDFPPPAPATGEPAGRQFGDLDPDLRRRALAAIEAIRRPPRWGWKDPRNCLTLPFWLEMVPDLRVLICLRNPVEVVRSLHRRNTSSDSFGYNLWLRYHEALLRSAPPERTLVTHYDSFFFDLGAELRRILAWLGWEVPAARLEAAGRILRPGLRHNLSERSDLAQACAPAGVRQTYTALCEQAGPVFAAGGENGPAAPGRRLVFLHIPKTAGSTLRRIIERQYDPDLIFTLEGWRVREKDFRDLPADDRARIQVLAGHQFFGLHELLPEPSSYVTMLRDPVERLISQYYHILRSPEHYLHRQVTEDRLSLAEFAAADLAPELDNGQVRYLAGLKDQGRRCTAEHLEIAKRHLAERFLVAGLAERFDESVLLMKHLLGWRLPVYTRTNVARNRPPRSTIPAPTIEALRRACSLDRELYSHASRLLDRQVAEQGELFQRELTAFQTLNTLSKTARYLEHLGRDLARKLNQTGQRHLQAGAETWALQAFLKAAEIWPRNLPAHLQLARIFLARGEVGLARPPVEAALNLDPVNQEARDLRLALQGETSPERITVPAKELG